AFPRASAPDAFATASGSEPRPVVSVTKIGAGFLLLSSWEGNAGEGARGGDGEVAGEGPGGDAVDAGEGPGGEAGEAGEAAGEGAADGAGAGGRSEATASVSVARLR